jgi:hypothetical protein
VLRVVDDPSHPHGAALLAAVRGFPIVIGSAPHGWRRTLSAVAFFDPTGTRYGLPTYPWRMAPAGLVTRRQLTAQGLRPGGQPVVAQVMWRSRNRTICVAYLYRVDAAKPKRHPSTAQLAALDRALAARRYCPECRTDAGYVLPRRWGVCLSCLDQAGVAA